MVIKLPEMIKTFRDREHAIAFYEKNCTRCARVTRCANAARMDIIMRAEGTTWHQVAKHHTPPKMFYILEPDTIGYCRLYREEGARVRRPDRTKQVSSYEGSDNADPYTEEPLFKNHT